MDNAQVCRHFKYGYCRFQDLCRYEHVKEVCDDVECSVTLCRKRHPRLCIYFSKFNRCKFGSFCQFSHDERQISPQCSHKDSLISTEIEKLKEVIKENKIEGNIKKIQTWSPNKSPQKIPNQSSKIEKYDTNTEMVPK